jgi:hypothetical protein
MPMTTDKEVVAGAREALLRYQQADADGIMVLVSRQAIHEVVDALDAAEARERAIETAFEPVQHWYQSDEEHMRPIEDRIADAVADLQEDRAENIKSKARERAAVAAAYEQTIGSLALGFSHSPVYKGMQEDAIRALSDTDALAEYVEKVRAEEREQTLAHYRNAIAQALQDGTDIFEAALGVEKHFAAIRQEISDD